MRKIKGKERYQIRKFAVERLRINGFYNLNEKNIINNKYKDIFNHYKTVFNREAYYDFMAIQKEEVKKLKNLVIREQLKNINESEYVYVIGNLEYHICKIGYSKNPITRLKGLQTGCPYKLQFLLVISGNRTTEVQLQKKYKRYKSSGEWFHFREGLKKSVQKIALTDKNLALQF